MQTVQRLLLLLFAAFAALTVLQQIRYGMICGRSEQEDKQDDPKAKACRQQSTIYAIAAAVSLIVNGFCKEVMQQLPMEFAIEAAKLINISLEGSVG